MEAKEKAKNLFNKYYIYLRANLMYDEEAKEDAKHCALISVNEILEATWKEIRVREKVTYSITGYDDVVRVQYDKFWQEVKQEIELL
jgi:hypothetical protein